MGKLKDRFINSKILLQNLPAFLCGCKKKNEEHLDNIIDNIEEELILDKAEEVRLKRLDRLGTHSMDTVSNALRTLRIAKKMGLIKREKDSPVEGVARGLVEKIRKLEEEVAELKLNARPYKGW